MVATCNATRGAELPPYRAIMGRNSPSWCAPCATKGALTPLVTPLITGSFCSFCCTTDRMRLKDIVVAWCFEALQRRLFSKIKPRKQHVGLKLAEQLVRSVLQNGELELVLIPRGVVFAWGRLTIRDAKAHLCVCIRRRSVSRIHPVLHTTLQAKGTDAVKLPQQRLQPSPKQLHKNAIQNVTQCPFHFCILFNMPQFMSI